MEYKHFSHPHALSFHQTPEITEAICSGCKSLLSSGYVYSCWQCNFFLHEKCFNAARSIDHPSHPSHPLSLFPSPTYPTGSFICNFCNLTGTGFSYSCSSCELDLHVHCANMPVTTTHEIPTCNEQYAYNTPENTAFGPQYSFPISQPHLPPSPVPDKDLPPPYLKHFSHHHALVFSEVEEEEDITCSGCDEYLSGSTFHCTKIKCDFQLHKSCFELPREIQHRSHPEHALVLLSSPPYEEHGEFTCNACSLTGTAFDYHCEICQFDLHVKCATLCETMKREDHEHPLKLLFSSPIEEGVDSDDSNFYCDVCRDVVEESCWGYYCQECDFGTHLDCVMDDQVSEADSLLAAQMRLKQLQLQVQMNQKVAQVMVSMGQNLVNLV